MQDFATWITYFEREIHIRPPKSCDGHSQNSIGMLDFKQLREALHMQSCRQTWVMTNTYRNQNKFHIKMCPETFNF
jgi:hypothetical protein